jgi:hypothetical protein
MKIFLSILLISILVINLSESRHFPKRKSVYICRRNLSIGAKVHVFLMKLMGKHDVLGSDHKDGCQLVHVSDASSEESDSDEISVIPKNLVVIRENEPKLMINSDSRSD